VVLTTHHPIAQCVDLRATFAGRFRFAWDESYEAERPEFRAVEAPWLIIIPGRHGRIFPWGGRRLAAYSASRTARRALEAREGVTVAQGGASCAEVIVTFDVSLIDAVAAIVGSKQPRKRLTPDQRAALIERGRGFRFPSTKDGANARQRTPDSTNGLLNAQNGMSGPRTSRPTSPPAETADGAIPA